jgi:hypothetical protein
MLLCALREWDRRLDFICATEGKKSDENEKEIVFDEPSKVLSLIIKRVSAKRWFFTEHHENWEDYIKVYLPRDPLLKEAVLRYIRFEVKGEYKKGERIGYRILMNLSGETRGTFSTIDKYATKEECLRKIKNLFKKVEEWKHPKSAVNSEDSNSIAPADHDVPVALEAKWGFGRSGCDELPHLVSHPSGTDQ